MYVGIYHLVRLEERLVLSVELSALEDSLFVSSICILRFPLTSACFFLVVEWIWVD